MFTFISIWKRAQRKLLKRGGPIKRKLGSWLDKPFVTFPWWRLTAVSQFKGWILRRLHLLADSVTSGVTKSNAAKKFNLHLPNLRAAPLGSFVARHVPELTVAWPFLRERAEERAEMVNDVAGHLPQTRPSHLIVPCSSFPSPQQTASKDTDWLRYTLKTIQMGAFL